MPRPGLGDRRQAVEPPARPSQPPSDPPHLPQGAAVQARVQKAEVNAIANFTFLTQETNLLVSERDPSEYMPAFGRRTPVRSPPTGFRWTGALEGGELPAFLTARRELLAKAANQFLDQLRDGPTPDVPAACRPGSPTAAIPGGVAGEHEEQLLSEINTWLLGQGLPAGEFMHELFDPKTGEALAVLDLAWPDGLQEGLSQPVALLIDEGQETEEAANMAGYRYFTDPVAFRSYVQKEILASVSAS